MCGRRKKTEDANHSGHNLQIYTLSIYICQTMCYNTHSSSSSQLVLQFIDVLVSREIKKKCFSSEWLWVKLEPSLSTNLSWAPRTCRQVKKSSCTTIPHLNWSRRNDTKYRLKWFLHHLDTFSSSHQAAPPTDTPPPDTHSTAAQIGRKLLPRQTTQSMRRL